MNKKDDTYKNTDILDAIIADAVFHKDGVGVISEDIDSREGSLSSSSPGIPYTDDEIDQGKALAVLAYIPFLCFIPYLRFVRSNRYAYDHGKQGVVLFLIEITVLLCVIFWQAALLIAALLSIYGIISVISGKGLQLPVIHELAGLIDHFRNKD